MIEENKKKQEAEDAHEDLGDGFYEQESDGRRASFVGTVNYLSPEMINNNESTIGIDLWALGNIIYKMLVGKVPFPGTNSHKVFELIRERKISFPSHLSP